MNLPNEKYSDENGIITNAIEYLFYGNYFYGICMMAIILETMMQFNLEFEFPHLFIGAFLAVVLYYNYPYARNYSLDNSNPRSAWYQNHQTFLYWNQLIFTLALIVLFVHFYNKYHQIFRTMSVYQCMMLLVFPILGALYYGVNFYSRHYNLRSYGVVKPFIIGFIWAGLANMYPLVVYDVIHMQESAFSVYELLLFFKTFMFVSMLAIMFDIKDFVADSRNNLNTWVVKLGLRVIIFYVIIPLTILGIVTFLSYAFLNQFNFLKIVLIMIPFLLLLATAISLKKRRSLLYYLIIIDGLLIAKAIFGILASLV